MCAIAALSLAASITVRFALAAEFLAQIEKRLNRPAPSTNFPTATTVSRVIQLAPASITEARAKAIAKRFFKEFRDRKLASLGIVPNTPKRQQGTMGATDVDPYYLWRRQWDSVVDYAEPLAYAISIDGNALLRVRNAHGRESRIVLTGSDPLMIIRNGLHSEIMQFGWTGSADHLTLRILIKTDRPIDQELAKVLVREYAARLGVPSIELVFRTDCWFVDEGFYPHFSGCGPPPSEADLRQTTSLYCSSFSGVGRCTVFHWNWGKR